MQEDDLNILQRIAAKEKVRYDELDINFKDKIVGTNCYVLIDFMSLLSNISSFKEGLVDDKDYELHVAIECLNIFAHYKHYFQTRDANHVILIGFVKDNFYYDKNQKVLDMLYEFSNYFPNIYTIPKIINKNGLYTHIVENIVYSMRNASNSSKTKQSSIFLISPNSSDRQLMFSFPTRTAYTVFKGYGFSKTNFISKDELLIKIMKNEDNYNNFEHKAELEYMCVLLGKYFNTFKFKNPKFDNNIEFKHTRMNDKIIIVNEFIEKEYNVEAVDNMCLQFLKYLLKLGEIDDVGFKYFSEYEQIYDYRFQNSSKINEVVIPLFRQWKQKIRDYSIARESENYKILISHMLYTNWLLT